MLKNMRRDAVHRVDDVAGNGQVAHDHVGAHRPQLVGAVVVVMHHRPHGLSGVEQRLHDSAADAANASRRRR